MADSAHLAAAQTPGDELWDAAWQPGAGEATIQERSEEVEGEPSAITLFCAWFCPFAQRAWIALEEKQVNYRYVEINTSKVRNILLWSSAALQGRSCRYAQACPRCRTQRFSQSLYVVSCRMRSRVCATGHGLHVLLPRTVTQGRVVFKPLGRVQVDPQEPGGYTKQPLPLDEKARRYPEFVEASPRGLVPADTHFGHHIWESIHVVEYMDSVFTGTQSCLSVLWFVSLLCACTTSLLLHVPSRPGRPSGASNEY